MPLKNDWVSGSVIAATDQNNIANAVNALAAAEAGGRSIELGLHGFLRNRSSGQRTAVLNGMNAVLDKGTNTVVNRQDFFWSDVQATEGAAYVWTAIDSMVAAAADKGIKTWAILTHPPAWATAAGAGSVETGWPCPPYSDVDTLGTNSSLDAFAAFCGAAAARYAEGGAFWDSYSGDPLPITHFEVWNEEYAAPFCKRYISGVLTDQDSQPDLYAEIYDAAAAEIWAVPNAIPAAALTDKTWNPDGDPYLDVFLANVTEPIGAASVHPYTNNYEPASYVPPFGDTYRWQYFTQVPDIRAKLDAAGHTATDLYITEVGWVSMPGALTEAEQASRFADLWEVVADLPYVRGLYLFTTTHPDAPDNPALAGYGVSNPECFYAFWHTGATAFDIAAAKPVVATVTALPPLDDRSITWGEVLQKPPVLDEIAAATGTRDTTTYLRGDNTWTVPPAGGGGGISSLTDLGVTATATELNYVDGVTSAVQTQLNTKVAQSVTANTLYGVNASAAQVQFGVSASATADTVAYRSTSGTLLVGTPSASGHAATKAYVDATAGAGSATTVPLSAKMQPSDPGPFPTARLTFTVTGTAPSYSGMQYLTFDTYAARFRYSAPLTASGGYGYNQISGATGGFGITGWEIEQDVYGADCAYMFQVFGDSDYYVEVDGVAVTKGFQYFASAGVWFLKFVFLDSKPVHRIRIVPGATAFAQLLVPSTGTAWPAPKRLKVLSVGDSFGHGGNATEGTISGGTINGHLRWRTGWDMVEMAQGGTGYKNPGAGSGSSIYGSAGRVAAAVALPYDPDLIFIYGGANDGSYTPISATVTLAEACWSAYAAAFPGVPIVVSGVESGVYPSIATDLDNLDIALQTAAEAHANVTAYIQNRRHSPNWVYGTGDRAGFVNDGNADFAVSGVDHVHPTEFAWDQIHTRLIVEQLKSVHVPADLGA